jgi:hypothetical protein
MTLKYICFIVLINRWLQNLIKQLDFPAFVYLQLFANKYVIHFVLFLCAEFVVHLLDKTIARYPFISLILICVYKSADRVNFESWAIEAG